MDKELASLLNELRKELDDHESNIGAEGIVDEIMNEDKGQFTEIHRDLSDETKLKILMTAVFLALFLITIIFSMKVVEVAQTSETNAVHEMEERAPNNSTGMDKL